MKKKTKKAHRQSYRAAHKKGHSLTGTIADGAIRLEAGLLHPVQFGEEIRKNNANRH
jgi:hypothetical protein